MHESQRRRGKKSRRGGKFQLLERHLQISDMTVRVLKISILPLNSPKQRIFTPTFVFSNRLKFRRAVITPHHNATDESV